ncbi:MAG TPA: HAMP domain-containing sensor histidine kinase, partial [Gemmatimonadaceae bacterium]|nr:HAMP domain-containing sensor histidine kinase [Gemmatimonadaceae bacterium]
MTSSRGMDLTDHCPLAAVLAERLRQARNELTGRWLERISERVRLHPNLVFPTEELLDHMPLLIEGVADYVEHPARVVSSELPVVAKAMELGELRYAQGFDEHELLKEYELFGGVLYAFLARTVDDLDTPCTRSELMMCAHRVFHAVTLIQQATFTEYFARSNARIREREERLRAFNRALTHEFKNRIGAAIGAAQILDEIESLGADERQRLAGVVLRNVGGMRGMLDNLVELSRLGTTDGRHQRHVTLPRAAGEAARQLRDAAQSKGVEIRLRDLPAIEVNAAAVELSLANLLSNAIKYADPEKPTRWVEVDAVAGEADAEGMCELVIRVRDNGLGVPEANRAGLFERFFRAHAVSAPGIEGTGLGLSIVRETAESLGGKAWAEFPAGESVFAFSL